MISTVIETPILYYSIENIDFFKCIYQYLFYINLTHSTHSKHSTVLSHVDTSCLFSFTVSWCADNTRLRRCCRKHRRTELERCRGRRPLFADQPLNKGTKQTKVHHNSCCVAWSNEIIESQFTMQFYNALWSFIFCPKKKGFVNTPGDRSLADITWLDHI